MKAILTCDDFGLTFGFCQAITDCYLQGCATSTSIVVNGPAYNQALKLIQTKLKKISLGLHLNLTHGPAFSKSLSTTSGNYRFQFADYLIRLIRPEQSFLSDIRKDIRSQFEIAIKRDHLPIDHVDGHDHIHMIPAIFEIVCQECQQYGISYLRITKEPYHLTPDLLQNVAPLLNKNIFKLVLFDHFAKQNQEILQHYHLKTNQACYGLLHSNNINYLTLTTALKNALNTNLNTIEIAFHPAHINHSKDTMYLDKLTAWFANLPQRAKELQLLTDPKLQQFIHQNKIVLAGFEKP